MKTGTLPYQAKEHEEIHSFTNEYGERWAVVFNNKSGKGVLLGDEVGWDLKEGLRLDNLPKGFILSGEEMEWLLSCLDRFAKGA